MRAIAPNFAWLAWEAGERFADRPAFVERGSVSSFADLRARAAGVLDGLLAAGVGPGDRVAVFLHRGEDAAAAFFGALAAGAVGINVNSLYAPRQVEHVLRHSGASVLLTSAELLGALPRALATDARVLDIAGLPRTGGGLPAAVTAQSPAQLTYTSGSTGQPKGVLFSHANLWAGVEIVRDYLGIRADDRIASVLPFSFVYGFSQLSLALASGAALVIERSALPHEVVAQLRAQEVTILAAVPPLWNQLLGVKSFRESPLASLRLCTNAGGRLAPESVKALRAAQPQAQVVLMYGLTEVFRATYLDPAEVDAFPDSMGRPIPGAEVYVVDESGRALPPGEVGELVYRGPTVGLGYWNDPEATERVFRPHPFLPPGTPAAERVVFSGDLVRRDEAGRLFYVGRRDRMIKTLGYRISPDEVADVLYASGLVTEAVVAGEPDAQRGERIVAFVVLREGVELPALQRAAAAELPRYMLPARWDVRDALPRNATGKFDLQALAPTPATR